MNNIGKNIQKVIEKNIGIDIRDAIWDNIQCDLTDNIEHIRRFVVGNIGANLCISIYDSVYKP